MGSTTMFLQGPVFAKKSTLRKLLHSRSRVPHHQGKVGNTFCERFKPNEKKYLACTYCLSLDSVNFAFGRGGDGLPHF